MYVCILKDNSIVIYGYIFYMMMMVMLCFSVKNDTVYYDDRLHIITVALNDGNDGSIVLLP